MRSRDIDPFTTPSIQPFRLTIIYLLLLSGLFLSSHGSFSQALPGQNIFQQKAILFKNRVEYDSAVYYFKKSAEIYSREGDKKAVLRTKINIYDIYILQRDYAAALEGLRDAANELAIGFDGDVDLKADLLQVKGSYLLATGESDSARFYLDLSIKIRTAKYGPNDTLLHYANNKLGNLYLSRSDFNSAYNYHETALDLSLDKQNPINFLTASSYQNLGIAAHMKGDFSKAEECYTKSLQLKEKLFDYDDPALAKIYGNLGKFYTDLSQYNMALEYYDKSEKLLMSRYDRDNILFAYVYWNKGNVYTHKGDYIKATSYLSKAHSILEINLGIYNQDVLNVSLDLGFAYDKKGDTQLAIDFYNKAAKNKENSGIIKIFRNLGNIYQRQNELDSAEKYYLLSIEYAKKIFSGNSFDLALCYQYYGYLLAKQGRGKNSLWYYFKASDIFIQLFGRKNKDLSKIFLLQSEFYTSKNEYDSALNKIQAALITLLPEFEETDIKINPSFEDIILDLYLFEALILKAKTLELRYHKTNSIQDLYLILNTINLTLDLLEEMRKTYNEEIQIVLNNDARTIIDLGVTVTYKLFLETGDEKYLSQAFHFSEKGQAIILLSALRGLEAQASTSIPENAQNLEKSLSKELATYNNLLYQEKQKNIPDEAKLQLWSDAIFHLRITHDSLLNSYKKYYPEYFRLKYDYSTISADSALMRLPEDQAIIEYYMTDSIVVAFLLTDRKLSVKILGEKNILTGMLDSLQQNFTSNEYFNAGQKEFEDITTISAGLYEILIRPFESAIAGKRLIIIPDGELGYLSFDLLLKEKPPGQSQAYNDLPWLIKSNPISYSSSATIHFEQTKRSERKISANLLAFAPSYNYENTERSAGVIDSVMLNLTPIAGTREEINSISGLFRTKKVFDDKATETYFKEHAGEYGILHLAMHTIIDNQNPMYSKLVFTSGGSGSQDDGYLNTYELFSLHLPGQLAVLSACNTGGGKLERGEGIISLARGFFYAGIPSVVMTLWEIEDHSSADLMAIFYENLKKGFPSDIALQRAKIAYMEKAGKLQSHPYFWAGYMVIGKTDSIVLTPAMKTFHLILLGSAFLVLIILIYLFINRRVFFGKNRH